MVTCIAAPTFMQVNLGMPYYMPIPKTSRWIIGAIWVQQVPSSEKLPKKKKWLSGTFPVNKFLNGQKREITYARKLLKNFILCLLQEYIIYSISMIRNVSWWGEVLATGTISSLLSLKRWKMFRI